MADALVAVTRHLKMNLPIQSSGFRFPFEFKATRHQPPGAATRHPKRCLSLYSILDTPYSPHPHLCTGRRPICTFAPRTARGAVPTPRQTDAMSSHPYPRHSWLT